MSSQINFLLELQAAAAEASRLADQEETLIEAHSSNVVSLRSPEPASVASLLPIITAASLYEKPVPVRQWLVEGLIPKGVPTNYSGDGGTGKSQTALQLAICVALGRDWFGKATMGGRVLFVTAEDDIDETHRRLLATCHGEGVSIADLDKLEICSLVGMDAVMGLSDNRSNKVSETPLFTELRTRVSKTHYDLVVLDTLADLFSGDENNRTQARQFIGLLRQLPTTVLLLSHPSVAGMQSGTGTSGSTAWSNSVRSRLYLSYPKNDAVDDENSDERVLSNKKLNYGKRGDEIKLRWSNGRFVADSAHEQSADSAPYDTDQIVLALVDRVIAKGYSTTRSRIGVTISGLPESKQLHGALRIRAKVANAAVDRLLDAGKLIIVEKGPKSDRVKHVALP